MAQTRTLARRRNPAPTPPPPEGLTEWQKGFATASAVFLGAALLASALRSSTSRA